MPTDINTLPRARKRRRSNPQMGCYRYVTGVSSRSDLAINTGNATPGTTVQPRHLLRNRSSFTTMLST